MRKQATLMLIVLVISLVSTACEIIDAPPENKNTGEQFDITIRLSVVDAQGVAHAAEVVEESSQSTATTKVLTIYVPPVENVAHTLVTGRTNQRAVFDF